MHKSMLRLSKDVSHETPDVAPCRTLPPMPFVRTCLARNARCDTMSHLTAAGCRSQGGGSHGTRVFSSQTPAIVWFGALGIQRGLVPSALCSSILGQARQTTVSRPGRRFGPAPVAFAWWLGPSVYHGLRIETHIIWYNMLYCTMYNLISYHII